MSKEMLNFKYKFAKYPNNKQLINDVNLAANRLYNRLKNLEIDKLQLSESMLRYFSHKVNDSLNTNLIKYSYHLIWALSSSSKLFKDIVLIDHGGGSGMFGLLAKELGAGTVIYNDISIEWTNDAQKIGNAIGFESDHYLSGDIDGLLFFLNKHKIVCDAIVSYNVIEHIYNINYFLGKLKHLNDSKLTVFISTGANKFNPFIANSIKKIHIRAEFGDQNSISSDNNTYSKIREDIIKNLSSKLTDSEIKKLTAYTRGMIKDDIKNCINNYLSTGKYPNLPDHRTNTCDPYTGYWAEHLMNPHKLKNVISNCGFKTTILTGYWGSPKQKIKRLISTILNMFLYSLGNKGLSISPYWTIFARN